jgi:hypothetical protein
MARNGGLDVQNRRLETRRLLIQRFRQDEVIQALQKRGYPASRRTYFRDLKTLRAEDQQWIRDQAKGEFVTDYRLVIESLQEQVRQAELIRSQSEKASEKLEATQLIAEIEVQIADLLAQGPTVLGLKAAGERVQEATRGET